MRVKPPGHGCSCGALAGALVLVLASAVHGGAPTRISASPEEKGGDAIATARRDLEAIRAAKDPRFVAPVPKVGGALAMPELRTAPPPSPTPSPVRNATTPAKAETNWLVDAMERERERERDAHLRRALPGRSWDRESERDARASLTEDGDRQTGAERSLGSAGDPEQRVVRSARAGDAGQPEARPAVANPLLQYLEDWLSPQDHAVLQPGLVTGAANVLGLPVAGAGAPGGGLDLMNLPGTAEGLPAGLAAPAPVLLPSAAPRANPFLEALETPVRFEPRSAGVPAPLPHAPGLESPSRHSQVAPAPAAPASPPTRQAIPDFAKPGADEKYFKQLKRF